MDLLIKNIGELFDGHRILKNTSVYIENGRIAAVGGRHKADDCIDARGRFVMPGFVDSHTHALFAGFREFEVEWKTAGLSYHQIAERGGGIAYTVSKTRSASKEHLKKETMQRLSEMLRNGTTTVEIKSGYGLNVDTEIKMLETTGTLAKEVSLDIVPTFLAHAIPQETEPDVFVKEIISKMLPEIGKRDLARFCDVFCETDYFTVEQTRKILEAASRYGMKLKLHADEFSCIGCSRLAAELHAVSADHLLMTGDKELQLLATAGVIPTVLPATPFILNEPYPDVDAMLRHGLQVAVATDLNPNCYVTSMQFVVQLACYRLKMKPLDALRAATINAARALAMDHEVGSIERGKKADILIMDVPSHLFIFYKLGINHVATVIKNGDVIYSNE